MVAAACEDVLPNSEQRGVLYYTAEELLRTRRG